MALVGYIEDIRVFDLLRFMKRLSRTGVLKIEGEKKAGEIYFMDGVITAVYIGNKRVPEEDMLKESLSLLSLKAGGFILTPKEIEEIPVQNPIDPDEIIRHLM